MMIALIALYMVLALSFSMSKGVLLYASPVFFTGVRMIIAGLLLLGYHKYKNRSFAIQKNDGLLFVQLAVFHVFVAYVFEFWALETVSASTDALFFNLTSFITALLSFALCNERLSIKQWIGLSIGFVGFLPLFYAQQQLCAAGDSISQCSLLGCFSFSQAELLLLGAVSGCSYGWIVMQRLVKNDLYHTVFVNGVSMFLGGVISLVVSYMTESVFIKTTLPDLSLMQSLGMVAWYTTVLIVLTNIISYNAYGMLLKTYSATFLALAGSMTPIFTALFDWLLFGEMITWHFVATVLLVAVGLCIFYLDELKSTK